jgi:hypothetical protein
MAEVCAAEYRPYMPKRFVPILTVIACAAPILVTAPASAQEPETPPAETPAPEAAGGSETAPAPPAATTPPPEETKDDLGLEWVWLNADVGFSYADLKSAKLAISPAGGSPIAVVDTTTSGPVYGFGAGVRLLFLTVGLRARNHTAMNLWQIDGEVGLHGRMGRVEPYLAGRFGYATVGTLSQSVQVAGSSGAPPDVSVHGWNGGLAIGVDYYVSHYFSIGAEGAGDALFLERPAATPPALTPQQQAVINNDPAAKANYQKLKDAYQASASSVGFGGALTAHVGIHF